MVVMQEQHRRIVQFVTFANWILFVVSSMAGALFFPVEVALGIVAGGLIVTINFHMLHRTLKKAFTPPKIASGNLVLAKYYIRFTISGFLIFVLISGHYVNPFGLIMGLSVVVISIMLATLREIKLLIFKEAI